MLWNDRLQIARMQRIMNPIFSITMTFHFFSSDVLPSELNLFNVPHEKLRVISLCPLFVGAPTRYLKTRPSRGANQHNCQSNDWQHKAGKPRPLEGQPEKVERRLESTENQDCTAATRVQADAVRTGAVSRFDWARLQADGRDRSCSGEDLLRARGNWGGTGRCFKGMQTVWIINCMGSRDGAVVRALSSHQCDPGSIPARYHMWLEFVVGSRLNPRVFLRVLRFSSCRKNQHLQILIRPG